MNKIIVNNILKSVNRWLNPSLGRLPDRLKPLSEYFSYDRGDLSVHRFYIDQFVNQHSDKILGKVLEVGDSRYISKHSSRVTDFSILNFSKPLDPKGIHCDLTDLETLPEWGYNAFICTQTFNFIYNFPKAIEGAFQLLDNGGYLLATVSGIQQISKHDDTRWGDYWRFTAKTCQIAFSEIFGAENVSIITYGNIRTTVAALDGMAANELRPSDFDFCDPNFQLVIGIVARKVC